LDLEPNLLFWFGPWNPNLVLALPCSGIKNWLKQGSCGVHAGPPSFGVMIVLPYLVAPLTYMLLVLLAEQARE